MAVKAVSLQKWQHLLLVGDVLGPAGDRNGQQAGPYCAKEHTRPAMPALLQVSLCSHGIFHSVSICPCLMKNHPPGSVFRKTNTPKKTGRLAHPLNFFLLILDTLSLISHYTSGPNDILIPGHNVRQTPPQWACGHSQRPVKPSCRWSGEHSG